MGVKDLWQLISPVGRRVSIETLEGKTLAIDMSIWLTQFIKAMRDEDGKMVKNAHIIGTLRRILKLLYHRIRPVFVFDGATPALKLRVIQQRRKTHEKSEQNRRSAIHRLLLAQLKQQITLQANSMMAESSKQEEPANFVPGFKPAAALTTSPAKIVTPSQSAGVLGQTPSREVKAQFLPNVSGVEEPYSKSQLDHITSHEGDDIEWTDGNDLPKIKNLEDSEEDSEDGDEPVWTLPEDNDALDVDVLTSLPVGIRKRIIEDAKRRERARSRATFMPVADNPILYSQTQLANFLQSSKLNRRFDEAHKKLAGNLENEGRAIAGENKRYQFISREDLKKRELEEEDAPEEFPSSHRRLLKRSQDEVKVEEEEDADEEFTADDWARPSAQAVPKAKTISSRLARKRRFIEELDEDRNDSTSAADPIESTAKKPAEASAKSKSKSSQFRSRFFDDFDGEGVDEDCEDGDVPAVGVEDSVTMKRPETFQIGRKVWQEAPQQTTFSGGEEIAADRRTSAGGEVASEIADLLHERAQRSDADSDDDSYGAGGGFFVEEEEPTTAGVAAKASTTAVPPPAPEAMDVEADVRPATGEETTNEEPIGKPVPVVSYQTAQEAREAAEFRQMMWEDDEVDNIAWESDNPDEIADASTDEDEDGEEGFAVENSSEERGHDSFVDGAAAVEVIVIDDAHRPSSTVPLVLVDDDVPPPREMKNVVIDMTSLDEDANGDHEDEDERVPVADILREGPAPLLSLNDDDDDFEEMYGGHRDRTTSASSASKKTDAAVSRAISTASNMADWAGRVVRRVLKEHIAPPTATANASLPAQPSVSLTAAPSMALKTEPAHTTEPSAGAIAAPGTASQHAGGPTSTGALVRPASVSWAPAASLESSYEEPPSSLGGGILQQLTQESDILQDLSEDIESTRKAMATSARDAERITEEMKEDVLRLIQAFDLPFIIAPYEAEAQCAVLEELGVVDGVITEDSDSFLFGARAVYKNIFNDRKFVEVYYADDIVKEMGLSREDLIALAFFLGSDYTEGVHGIGIVNAMEILQAFSMKESSGGPVEGLKKFRRWLEGYDFAQDILESFNRRKAASASTEAAATKATERKGPSQSTKRKQKKKKQPKGKRVFALGEVETFSSSEDDGDEADDDDEGDGDMDDDADGADGGGDTTVAEEQPSSEIISETMTLQLIEQRMVDFEKKHKNGRSKWTVPANFPDETVAKAYFHPNTNRNADPFVYIPPSRSKVRRYVSDVLGWSDALLDAQIDPVLQRFADRSIQMRVDAYYTTTYQDDARFAKIASERLREAVVKITGQQPIHLSTATSTASPAKKVALPAIENDPEGGLPAEDASAGKKRSRGKAAANTASAGDASHVKKRRTTNSNSNTKAKTKTAGVQPTEEEARG